MVYGAGDTGNWEIIIKKGQEDVFGVVEEFEQGPRPGAAGSSGTSTAAAAAPAKRPAVPKQTANKAPVRAPVKR